MSSKSLFILGPIPPPPGGVSNHVQREAVLFARNGWEVNVFGRNATFGPSVSPEQFKYYKGHPLMIGLIYLFRLIAKRPRVVHIHLSAINNLRSVKFLTVISKKICPIIFTIHSGSFVAHYSALDDDGKRAVGRLLGAAAKVIGVNESIGRLVRERCGLQQSQVEVIPAYLYDQSLNVLPNSTPDLDILVAAGYGTEIYYWEGLLDAVSKLDDVKELVLVFYAKYHQDYYTSILKRADELRHCLVTVYNDLLPEEFGEVLNRAGVFVRPTLADGDSVALREAMACGCVVIASDVVERPNGSVVFESENVADLRRKLANRHSYERQSFAGGCEFGDSLLKAINEVVS